MRKTILKIVIVSLGIILVIAVFIGLTLKKEELVVSLDTSSEQEDIISEMGEVTERYSARIDRVDVVFEHSGYTHYRLTTNGLVREGELNTERGYGDDPNATVYVLNWQRPESEQMYYVRLTAEPGRIYALGSNREIVRGNTLLLEEDALPAGISSAPIASFSWVMLEAETGNEYRETRLSLRIHRDDGTTEERHIATVDGTCNAMPVETELALGSEQVLCYYAGFGYQFRVVDEGDSYAVQQKEIEEASPDYDPPVASFETILRLNK